MHLISILVYHWRGNRNRRGGEATLFYYPWFVTKRRNASCILTLAPPPSTLVAVHHGSLIPYCLWVHTVFALYMYGNGSVFPVPEEDDGQSAEEAVVQASGVLNFTGKLKVKVCLHREKKKEG